MKTVPYADANHYQKLAPRVAAEIEGAVCANQFDNTANRDAHYATTGPEIWHETGGRVDAFTCATGTGGTLGGVSRYLKQQRPGAAHRARGPDGQRAVRLGQDRRAQVRRLERGHRGHRHRPRDGQPRRRADRRCRAHRRPRVVRTTYRLLREEGLFLGSTSGVNVAAAVRVARDLGPGHTIVTILCDGGQKYLSRFYNPEWLVQKGLAEHAAAPGRRERR